MNYYPFHLGDYASATRHLTWDEDLAYRRLIDVYYTREAPIPSDMRQAYRLVCASTVEQREAVDSVLQEFFEDTPEGWFNARCDAEIHAAAVKRDKASQSAHARWGNASAKQTQCEVNANAQESICERMELQCEGNAPNPNPNPNISTTDVVDKKPRAARFDAQAHLVSLGVNDLVAADWIKLRKLKRAEVTKTAIDGILPEVEKAGMTLDAALREGCSRGWTSFKAKWIEGDPARASPSQTLSDKRANTIAELTGRNRNERTDEHDITGESRRVA